MLIIYPVKLDSLLMIKKNNIHLRKKVLLSLNNPHSNKMAELFLLLTDYLLLFYSDGLTATDELTAADVVSNLSVKLNKSSCSRFNINRANVWDGALRGFKRSTYNPTFAMRVRFTDDVGQSEEALDTGGPTREFLTLLIDAMKTRRVFDGKDHSKYLSFDSKGNPISSHLYNFGN